VTGQVAHQGQRRAGRSTGELYDGTPMDGPDGLRRALLKHRTPFVLSFTESLMTYALGRRVEATTCRPCAAIVRDAAPNDYKMSSFVQGIVKSPAFRMSRGAAPRPPREAAAEPVQAQKFVT
jgi:hypothetical protein